MDSIYHNILDQKYIKCTEKNDIIFYFTVEYYVNNIASPVIIMGLLHWI